MASLLLVAGLGLPGAAPAQEPAPAPADEATLRSRIAAITVADVAWRAIPWKTCLLEGLVQAQRERKPLLVWCQIDRPADDTRC
jgi:hypothetical protein